MIAMEKYLQIPIALYMTLVATFGWDMVPKKTVYKYNDGVVIYVVDGRWVDSVGLEFLPAKPIDRDMPASRMNVVYLDSNDIAK